MPVEAAVAPVQWVEMLPREPEEVAVQAFRHPLQEHLLIMLPAEEDQVLLRLVPEEVASEELVILAVETEATGLRIPVVAEEGQGLVTLLEREVPAWLLFDIFIHK